MFAQFIINIDNWIDDDNAHGFEILRHAHLNQPQHTSQNQNKLLTPIDRSV